MFKQLKNKLNFKVGGQSKNLTGMLVVLSMLGMVSYVLIAFFAPFSYNIFNVLFPKQPSHAAALVDLSLTQPKVQAAVGTDFTLNVQMNTNSSQVSSAEVHVK